MQNHPVISNKPMYQWSTTAPVRKRREVECMIKPWFVSVVQEKLHVTEIGNFSNLSSSDKCLMLNFNLCKYIGRWRKTYPSSSIRIRTQATQAQQESCVWYNIAKSQFHDRKRNWAPSPSLRRKTNINKDVFYFCWELLRINMITIDNRLHGFLLGLG